MRVLYWVYRMKSERRSLLVALGALASVTFIVAACGSDPESEFGSSGGISKFEDGGSIGDPNAQPDSGDPFANDPPPQWCGPAGQPVPAKPTGTEECPDDKNKPGCGCPVAGETAPCWTGLRVNRNLGVCKDGVTKCSQISENVKAWGPCEGQVLPASGQAKGADACKCFSLGQWKLANLSPCFVAYNANDQPPHYAVSTAIDPADSIAKCPVLGSGATPPPVNPNPIWTTDTLKVDCAGHFKICYELKAGNADAPEATDCSLSGKLCVEADYVEANKEQAFPDLPRWNSADTACAARWRTVGGYGEMSVVGQSVLCDKVDDGAGNAFVFNRIKYCPTKCEKPENASDPDCINCKNGGSGEF